MAKKVALMKSGGLMAIAYAVKMLAGLFPGQPRFRTRRRSKYGNGRTKQGELCKNFKGHVTRQQIRASLREASFLALSQQFPGERRKTLRRLALALARNRYKAQTTGVPAHA